MRDPPVCEIPLQHKKGRDPPAALPGAVQNIQRGQGEESGGTGLLGSMGLHSVGTWSERVLEKMSMVFRRWWTSLRVPAADRGGCERVERGLVRRVDLCGRWARRAAQTPSPAGLGMCRFEKATDEGG